MSEAAVFAGYLTFGALFAGVATDDVSDMPATVSIWLFWPAFIALALVAAILRAKEVGG